MHIGIEAHGFWGKAEGQAKAIHGLVRALSRVDTENHYTLFFDAVRRRGERLETIRNQIANPKFNIRLFPLPSTPHPAILFLRERVVWPWLASRAGIDVFHATSYRAIFAPTMRTVLTIHDFAYHETPEMFTSRSLAYYRRLPADAARATIVVTVSEYTKQDAMRLLGLPSSKIRVVYNGVDLERFRPDLSAEDVERIRLRYGLDGRTILSVGNLSPKKNIVRLTTAFDQVRKRVQDARLVLAGTATRYGRVVSEVLEAKGLGPYVRFTGYVPDEDLPLLYRAAHLFAYPSLFEGFGLPVLESMACGTPVVASNTTSIPEVAGDAALLVNPLDVDQMAEAMATLLTDNSLRRGLIERGLQRSQRFSWEEAAHRILGTYKDATSQK